MFEVYTKLCHLNELLLRKCILRSKLFFCFVLVTKHIVKIETLTYVYNSSFLFINPKQEVGY